jgi:hypothetical protein
VILCSDQKIWVHLLNNLSLVDCRLATRRFPPKSQNWVTSVKWVPLLNQGDGHVTCCWKGLFSEKKHDISGWPVVNFINILRAAFTRADPEIAKKTRGEKNHSPVWNFDVPIKMSHNFFRAIKRHQITIYEILFNISLIYDAAHLG